MLKIRAVGLTVVNGKWSCDYTDQGIAARQRALDRGYRGSRPPQPRDQSLHRSNKRRYFQYAVRSTHYRQQSNNLSARPLGGSGDAGVEGGPVHVHPSVARRAKQVVPKCQIPIRLIGYSSTVCR